MDPKAQRRYERDAENALIDLEEQVAERWEYAQGILKIQSDATWRAVSRMVEQMHRMTGPPVFRFRGQNFPVEQRRLEQIQHKNLTWIAVRLFVACATWDIQIASFKLPANQCAKCGVEI